MNTIIFFDIAYKSSSPIHKSHLCTLGILSIWTWYSLLYASYYKDRNLPFYFMITYHKHDLHSLANLFTLAITYPTCIFYIFSLVTLEFIFSIQLLDLHKELKGKVEHSIPLLFVFLLIPFCYHDLDLWLRKFTKLDLGRTPTRSQGRGVNFTSWNAQGTSWPLSSWPLLL